jgi:endonuclease YncB( thermonuclease family)
MRQARYYLVVVALWVCAGLAHAGMAGPVVAVLDGDTVDVLVDLKPVRVRLAEIDAPEKGQPFGTRSRQALASAVFRQQVSVRVSGNDRYGRTIGTLLLDGVNINHWMVAEGWAWAYRPYVVDRRLFEIEAAAKAAGRGLWSEPEPVPPWEWRRRRP